MQYYSATIYISIALIKLLESAIDYALASEIDLLEDVRYFIMQPILQPRVVLRKLCKVECNLTDVQDVKNDIYVTEEEIFLRSSI